MSDQPTGALPPPSGTKLTWNEVVAEEPKSTTPNDIFGAMPDFPGEIEEPKPIGEWTAAYVSEIWQSGGNQNVANAHNAALAADRKETEGWKRDKKQLREQALAAEREEKKRYSAATWDMADLRRELDAEREKVQTLVDALLKLRQNQKRGQKPIIDASLAKVRK